jgi:hypothetical protein
MTDALARVGFHLRLRFGRTSATIAGVGAKSGGSVSSYAYICLLRTWSFPIVIILSINTHAAHPIV